MDPKRFALAAPFVRQVAGDASRCQAREGCARSRTLHVLTSTLKSSLRSAGPQDRSRAAGEDREVHVKDRDFHTTASRKVALIDSPRRTKRLEELELRSSVNASPDEDAALKNPDNIAKIHA